ncbi:MAG TPA: hypothetical protein VLV45_11770 [Gemmatimonadales bacterium]|nr:hypothetical protein [Gemmatimonadales bacterium]
MLWLRLIHIVFGTFWTGAAIFSAFFLLPAARTAGPAAGALMSRLGPRIGPTLGVASLLTIISGFIMFGQLGALLHSPRGMALGIGALAALLAFVVGFAVSMPAAAKLGKLMAASGPPSPAQAGEMATLQARNALGARLAAICLIVAVGAMAVARYV